MKIWMIWIQGDETTWLEEAWDDETTAENPQGWKEAVDKCRELAHKNNYEMRIVSTDIAGIYEAFEIPQVANTGLDS